MIKLINVCKNYGKKEVLKNINIELPKNKIIAFIGSNGAGKSTLLSTITRTLSKDKGKILIYDKELELWNSKEIAKYVSVLKQSNSINLRLTVKELVSFGRFPYSNSKLTKEDEEKIDEAIRYMNLFELENRYLDELSGGQRQMAFIAMVIAQDTEYIFLDEPLNNLDMKHSVKIMKVLRRLVDELNKTIMVVIHDINFVSCYADYIFAMKNGEIIEGGNVEEIISSEVLNDIYDMKIDVNEIEQNKICTYYV